jgi:hypothetical protein
MNSVPFGVKRCSVYLLNGVLFFLFLVVWCSLLFSMNDFLVSFFLMRMNWMKFGSGVRIVELLGLFLPISSE